MNINFIYDPSVSNAPAGFITALNTVAQSASQTFTDPITINIRVGWGEVNGALAAGGLDICRRFLKGESPAENLGPARVENAEVHRGKQPFMRIDD